MEKTFTLWKFVTAAVITVSIMSATGFAEPTLQDRKLVTIKSETATVSVDLAGGAIAEFRLNGSDLNPLNWNHPEKGDVETRPMSHFICFDRWGQPSAQEQKNGMPFHGEASNVVWSVLNNTGGRTAQVLCKLPMGGMTLNRTLTLSATASVLTVAEEITNINKLGRVYNIVQHPSIGPPFLDESTLVDSNALNGFMQESPWPNSEEPVIYWPEIAYKGKLVDLRKLADNHNPGVTSFVFSDDETTGWVTACNADRNLMIGYIWNLEEYPWLNIWRNSKDGKPSARGLEFGTTGLHRPFTDMLAKQTMFDRKLYEYIDAGESVTKTYTAFLVEIPGNYKGVESIESAEGKITIKEQGAEGSEAIVLNY